MIGRLRGTVAEVSEEDALIDVMGVGYVVRCGSRTLGHLPPVGDEALLHVESQFGEQTGLTLYGFLAREDRRAFVLLLTAGTAAAFLSYGKTTWTTIFFH